MLVTKPSVKSLEINFFDLYYNVITNRDEKKL